MTTDTAKTNKLPTWLRAVFALVAFTAAGLAFGWLTSKVLQAANFDFALNIGPISAPALIAGCVLLLVTTVVAHELGHLLGGWLVGFRFLLFIVGPLKLMREGNRIRVRLNKDVSLYGGITSAMPTNDQDLMRRTAIVILGGPLTSLVLGTLSLALAAWTNANIAAASPWSAVTLFAFFFGVTNLAIFVATMIPGKTGSFDTDGAQLLDVLRGGHRAERRWLTISLAAASMEGVRPRDWNPAQVERLLALREGTVEDVMANYLGYFYALDRGEVERAGELLDLCRQQAQGFPEAARPMIFAEAAYFAARYRQDTHAARMLLEQAQGGFIEKHSRLRAEAAVLLAEGKPVESAEKARAALVEAGKSWDKGGAAAEKDWLMELLKRTDAPDSQSKLHAAL
ncbi:MAG: hypothetical protein RMK99_16685 [Anaerolineales bacterium]|nr:hypothetical protein [Anaerolineales bacterium]